MRTGPAPHGAARAARRIGLVPLGAFNFSYGRDELPGRWRVGTAVAGLEAVRVQMTDPNQN